MPKLIIFDLDGTLTESKSALSLEMGIRLGCLLLRMQIAIMSGGSYAQFKKQLLSGIPRDANLKNLYLFPTSAAQCYTWQNGEWHFLYDNPLTSEEKSRIFQALSESLRETGLDQPPPQLWGEQIENRGTQITWSALGQEAPIEMKKLWDPDRKKRTPLQAALLTRLPDFSVRINATNSIDITRKGMTKAYGIRQLSHITHLPISSMLYIGDALFPGGNDAIVKETGIATEQVDGPEGTARVIERILAA